MDQADILCLITGNIAAKLGQRSQQPSINVSYTYRKTNDTVHSVTQCN